MWDLFEFSTSPKPHNVFYKVTGSATTFAIRANANAVIGLSVLPGNSECEVWILVGYNGRCWIKTCRDTARSVMNNTFLCQDEYRKFWLTWFNGMVSLGEEGCDNSIVSCRERTCDFNYITFTVVTQTNHVQWQINMPPALESKKPKAEIKGLPHWTLLTEGEEFPDDALIGGFENEVLYIARAPHMGSLTPGKYVPSTGKAYISWDGWANEKTYTDDIEILCGFNLLWVRTESDKIPVGAFAVGYSEIGSEPLYVGRTLQDGHLIPGKFHSPYKSLLYSYNGRECSANKFEILVLPGKNVRVDHDTFCFDTHLFVHPAELDANVIDNDID